MEQQRLHQEERVRKALERAKAEPKKQVIVFLIIYFEQLVIRPCDCSSYVVTPEIYDGKLQII